VVLDANAGGRVAAKYGSPGVSILGNTVSNVGSGVYSGDGISIRLIADNSGHIDANGPDGYPGYLMPIYIDGNAVSNVYNNSESNVYGNGIEVEALNGLGFIAAKAEIGYYGANTVSNVAGNGIGVYSNNVGGFIVSEAVIENNSVTGALTNGISVSNFSAFGDTYSYNDITGNSVTGPSAVGINVADFNYGGVIKDGMGIGGNDVHGAALGIDLVDVGAVQNTVVAGNKLYGDDTTYGIAGYAYGAAAQSIDVYTRGNHQYGIPAGNQYYFYYEVPGTQLVF
jgi:hypothetical protein